MAWRKTIFNMAAGILTPCNLARSWHWFRQVISSCNVACSSGIVTLNSPVGSTLQCGRWLCDNMPLNSRKRTPYWNSTSAFDFDHITAVDVSFCTSLWNFIQIGQPSVEKWRHVDFQDLAFQGSNKSLKKPRTTSSMETIPLKFFVAKIDKQMDRPIAWSRSRCRERRFNDDLSFFLCRMRIMIHEP